MDTVRSEPLEIEEECLSKKLKLNSFHRLKAIQSLSLSTRDGLRTLRIRLPLKKYSRKYLHILRVSLNQNLRKARFFQDLMLTDILLLFQASGKSEVMVGPMILVMVDQTIFLTQLMTSTLLYLIPKCILIPEVRLLSQLRWVQQSSSAQVERRPSRKIQDHQL